MSRYTIKRTSLITWEIIDWEKKKVIQSDIVGLSKAEKIVEELENNSS